MNDLIAINENENRVFCTLDLMDKENCIKLYNANENCDELLINLVGKKINIDDVYMTEYSNDETKKVKTIIFDNKNNKTYVSTAFGVVSSLNQIINIFGYPPYDFEFEIIKKEIVTKKGEKGYILKLKACL